MNEVHSLCFSMQYGGIYFCMNLPSTSCLSITNFHMRAYVPVYMYSHQSGGITCENWPTDFLFGGFLFVCFFLGFFFLGGVHRNAKIPIRMYNFRILAQCV